MRHSGSRLWFCKLFHMLDMMVENPKNFDVCYSITFKITGGWLTAGFFKGWIEVPHYLWGVAITMTHITGSGNSIKLLSLGTTFMSRKEILMQLSVSSPELLSVFIKASSNLLKVFFLIIKMQKTLKTLVHLQKVPIWFWKPSKTLFISWHCPFNNRLPSKSSFPSGAFY